MKVYWIGSAEPGGWASPRGVYDSIWNDVIRCGSQVPEFGPLAGSGRYLDARYGCAKFLPGVFPQPIDAWVNTEGSGRPRAPIWAGQDISLRILRQDLFEAMTPYMNAAIGRVLDSRGRVIKGFVSCYGEREEWVQYRSRSGRPLDRCMRCGLQMAFTRGEESDLLPGVFENLAIAFSCCAAPYVREDVFDKLRLAHWKGLAFEEHEV